MSEKARAIADIRHVTVAKPAATFYSAPRSRTLLRLYPAVLTRQSNLLMLLDQLI